MKKFLSCLLAVSVLMASVSAVPAMADVSFPDLANDHWAASSVEKLIATGTINGFEDGTFKPAGVVSRAEFVKMLGKSDVKRDMDFADVDASHWAYDYIMYSGLEGDSSNNFRPADVITRGEVASLLYKRFANGAVSLAPYFIGAQSEDFNVAAWVYNTGLMVGADMLDLRLEDTLTRAEAAVLIVRARELNPDIKRNFIDNFTDEAYRNVYNNSNLFDTEYVSDENITYEELSAAAIRYQVKDYNPQLNFYYEPKYEGQYAKYWAIMCSYALDEKGYTATKAEADKYVTMADALAMMGFAAKNNYHIDTSLLEESGNVHPGITFTKQNSGYASAVKFAYDYGISLYADGKIDANKLITKRELACMLLQYNIMLGIEIGYYCSGDAAEHIYLTSRLDSDSYPANSAFYPSVVNEIPNYVYEAPLAEGKEIQFDTHIYSRQLSHHIYIYTRPYLYLAADLKEKGINVGFTVYPSLAVGIKGKGSVCRVKFEVGKVPEKTYLSSVIPLSDGVSDRLVKEGDMFYMDVAENQQLTSTYIDYKLFTVDKIVG